MQASMRVICIGIKGNGTFASRQKTETSME